MNKSTIIAAAVFAGLLLAVFATRQEVPERGITRISFAEVQPDTVDRVELAGPKPVTLVKQDGTWTVDGGRAANEPFVTQLLEAVPKVKSSHLVTKSADRLSELQVGPENGTVVKVMSGGSTVAEFVVGKSVAGGAHVAVDGQVYLVNGLPALSFQRESSQWFRMEIVPELDASTAKTIDVKPAEGPAYALAKGEGENPEWLLQDPSVAPEGFRFAADQARSMVNGIVNLRASKVPTEAPDAATTGLGDDAPRIVVHPTEGEAVTLVIGKTEEGNTWILRKESGELFQVNEGTAKRLARPLDELRSLEFVELEPTHAQRITIQTPERTLVLAKDEAGVWSRESGTEEVPEDFEFDTSRVDQRLGAISRARGIELAAEGLSLDTPRSTITIERAELEPVVIAFGEKRKVDERELVLTTGNADGLVYEVTPWILDNLTGGLDTFKKVAPPPGGPGMGGMGMGGGGMPNIDPSALQNLPPEVRQQLMQQLQRQQQMQQHAGGPGPQ